MAVLQDLGTVGRQTAALIGKEFTIEWRQKYSLGSILLYAGGAVFLVYLSFTGRSSALHPIVWHTIYWVILLFSAVTVTARSFINEQRGLKIYYYTLAHPAAIILAKVAYNALMLVLTSTLSLAAYALFLKFPVQAPGLYLLNVGVAALGFACTLTLVSGIAAAAQAGHTIMPVLSFPLLVPQLLIHLKAGKSALDGLDSGIIMNHIWPGLGMGLLSLALSLLLFPFLWKA